MKTSVTARASRHNPQPTPNASVEKIITPGRIGLTKHITFVMEPGEVTIVNANLPGVRKYVISRLGDVRIVGENVTDTVRLKKPGDAVLLEFTGKEWKPLYTVKGEDK